MTDQGHILDLVLTRQPGDFIRHVSVGDFISDHRLVTCSLRARSPGWPTSTVQIRPLKSIDADALSADIRELPLLVTPSDSLEGLVQPYNEGLCSLVDKHAPLRPRTIVLRPTVPWWSSEIRNAKKALRKAEQR